MRKSDEMRADTCFFCPGTNEIEDVRLPDVLVQEAKEKRAVEERAAFEARVAASLDRSPDAGAACALQVILRMLSDDHYAASWIVDVEFDIWEMLPSSGHPYRDAASRQFGAGEVPEETLTKLRELHERAGGWWQWQSTEGCAGGPVFVTTEEWLALVAARKGGATP